MGNEIIKYLVIIIVIIALFFALREVNCWYLKINQRIKLMEEQNRLLNLLIKQKELNENPTEEIQESQESQETQEDISQKNVSHLKELIVKEKNKGIFGESLRQEIIDWLEKYCQSKDDCMQLIMIYQRQYNSDLIEDLKKLSTNYDTIKKILNVFIKYDVIEPEYPHNIK